MYLPYVCARIIYNDKSRQFVLCTVHYHIYTSTAVCKYLAYTDQCTMFIDVHHAVLYSRLMHTYSTRGMHAGEFLRPCKHCVYSHVV